MTREHLINGLQAAFTTMNSSVLHEDDSSVLVALRIDKNSLRDNRAFLTTVQCLAEDREDPQMGPASPRPRRRIGVIPATVAAIIVFFIGYLTDPPWVASSVSSSSTQACRAITHTADHQAW